MNSGASLRGDAWCDKWLKYDDVGDNISRHNGLLNEMTAIYWFWKHLSEFGSPEYVGFNHYRRFFKLEDLSDIGDFDIIVAKPVFSCPMPYSIAWQYNHYHVIQDLQRCCDEIKKFKPGFQSDFVDYVNSTGVNFAPCNMFVMKRELFQEWCEFVFELLFRLETVIDVSGRDNYQKRALAFLTERVFGFWCWDKMKNGFKAKQLDMIEKLEFKNNKLNERGTFG